MGTKSHSGTWTATRIAALPPGRHKDPAQQALYLLVRPRLSGGHSRTWLHRVKVRGSDSFLLVGHYPETGLAEARTAVQEQRELVSKGIDPKAASPRRRRPAQDAAAPSDKHSIRFLADEFLERHIKPRHKRPEYTQRILTQEILPSWGSRDARTIKPREVIELLDGIVARGSVVMANRTAAILGQMFKFGVHRAVIDSTPVQLLYRPGGKETARSRCLSDAELKILLDEPKKATRFDRLAHAMVFLLLTGQRRGELALARWRDIDFKSKTWTIPASNSKNGKGHTVPLSDWAIRELEGLQRLARRSAYVLPNDEGDRAADPKLLTRGIARCLPRVKKLGVEEFTLHDLRRTCRTGLARLKVPPHIAERVLNHVQEKIPGTYDVHDYLDEKRSALEQWSAHLESLK